MTCVSMHGRMCMCMCPPAHSVMHQCRRRYLRWYAGMPYAGSASRLGRAGGMAGSRSRTCRVGRAGSLRRRRQGRPGLTARWTLSWASKVVCRLSKFSGQALLEFCHFVILGCFVVHSLSVCLAQTPPKFCHFVTLGCFVVCRLSKVSGQAPLDLCHFVTLWAPLPAPEREGDK